MSRTTAFRRVPGLGSTVSVLIGVAACGPPGEVGSNAIGDGSTSVAGTGTGTAGPVGTGTAATTAPIGTSGGPATSAGAGTSSDGSAPPGSGSTTGTPPPIATGDTGTPTGTSVGVEGPDCTNPATLGEAGRCTNRLIGVALAADNLDDPQFAQNALEFTYVTPEDELKWDVTESQPGVFTFDLGDRVVDFALDNGMAVKGHTLVWHNQLPGWLTNIDNPDALRNAMVGHIQGVMSYYRGKVIAWDVVNEAFEDDGQLRDSIWSRNLGDSFIEDAFRAARAADPDVKLYYNDYDIESAYAKADAVYEMVRGLVERGVPIDGVGMQMHTRTTDEDPPIDEFIVNIDRIIDLGLEVVLSEMDVRLCAGGTFEQQSRRYHDIIEVCLDRPECTAITIWGITDRYSFLNARTDLQCAGAEPPRPLLWDDGYGKKPAYDAVMDALLDR